MFQTDYARGTKDSDILQTANLTAAINGYLISLAGKGSPLFDRRAFDRRSICTGYTYLEQSIPTSS